MLVGYIIILNAFVNILIHKYYKPVMFVLVLVYQNTYSFDDVWTHDLWFRREMIGWIVKPSTFVAPMKFELINALLLSYGGLR